MNRPSSLIKGKYYRLAKNINAIPAGIYKFVEEEGECLFFEVGKRIQFMITDDVMDYLEYSPPTFASLHRTTSVDFLEHYYSLLAQQNTKTRSTGGPMTACFIAE